MASSDQPEDTEADDKEAGAELDLALPFDKREEQREGKDHQQHRQQMADRQRPKRSHQPLARTSPLARCAPARGFRASSAAVPHLTALRPPTASPSFSSAAPAVAANNPRHHCRRRTLS